MNRTEHKLRMCFDEDYAFRYSLLVKERNQILLLYVQVLKHIPLLIINTFSLIFLSYIFGIITGILLVLMAHTLAWAAVAIPEYVKIKRKLGI